MPFEKRNPICPATARCSGRQALSFVKAFDLQRQEHPGKMLSSPFGFESDIHSVSLHVKMRMDHCFRVTGESE